MTPSIFFRRIGVTSTDTTQGMIWLGIVVFAAIVHQTMPGWYWPMILALFLWNWIPRIIFWYRSWRATADTTFDD